MPGEAGKGSRQRDADRKKFDSNYAKIFGKEGQVPQEVVDLNIKINLDIQYKADFDKDYWQSPEETFRLGTGDCEDIALLKFFKLKELGYQPKLAYAIMNNSEGHMYCLCDGYVLDCQVEPFRAVVTFDEESMYIEGEHVSRSPYEVFTQWKGIVEGMEEKP